MAVLAVWVLGEDSAADAARKTADFVAENYSLLDSHTAVLHVLSAFLDMDFVLVHLDLDDFAVQPAEDDPALVLQVKLGLGGLDLHHFAVVASAFVVERSAVPIRPVFVVVAATAVAFVVPNVSFWLVAVRGRRTSTSHRTSANRANRLYLGDEADSWYLLR